MVSARDKTVLVVDDEPNVRQYLRTLLQDAGFNVLEAQDGEEALSMVYEQRPDFISLDLIMPRKSGHRLLFELKRDPELSRIPVLVVTAHAQDDLGRSDLQDLLDNRVMTGPGTYLEKPVNPQVYVQSVQRALGVEPNAGDEARMTLRQELEQQLQHASPDVLRQALQVLKKRSG